MKKYPSFNEATQLLQRIVKLIEEHESEEACPEITAEFNSAFAFADNDVAASIDRRKFVLAEIEAKIELAKNYRDYAHREAKKYARLRDNLIANTKSIIESNPGIKFKDSLGKAVKVRRNPVPSLVVTELAMVPSRYIKLKPEIDKELIKEDLLSLQDDEGVEWAELHYGTQLNGLRS